MKPPFCIPTLWACLVLFAGLADSCLSQEIPQLNLRWLTNSPELQLQGPAGSRSTIYYRSAFSPLTPWLGLAEVDLSSGRASLVDSTATNDPTRFYRADFMLPSGIPSRRTLFVTPNGDDSSAEPDRADLPYGSVTNALAAAQNGDSILVYPGSYTVRPGVFYAGENPPLVIRNRTNLVLQAMGDVRIYGREQGDFFLLEKCRNIVIAGFTIEGHYEVDPSKVSLSLRAAVRFQGECSNILIENNRILHHNNHGIGFIKGSWLPSTNNIVIRNNYIHDVGYYFPSLPSGAPRYDGSAIIPVGGWLVEDNVIVQCARGIEPYPEAEVSPYCVVRGNTLVDIADFGISTGGSLGNLFCVVENNYLRTRPDLVFHGRPIETYSSGIEFGSGPWVRIRNNTILGFPRAGIVLATGQGTTNAVIEGNTIVGVPSGNGHGIAVESPMQSHYNEIIIRNNTIAQVNNAGISFHGRNSIIEGNHIFNPSDGTPGRNGIQIRSFPSAASSNILVRFNHIVEDRSVSSIGYGIRINSGAREIQLLGNTFRGVPPDKQIGNFSPGGVSMQNFTLAVGSTNLASSLVVTNALQAGALKIREGASDARMGSVTLIDGAATVITGAVKANSRIFLTVNRPVGRAGTPYVLDRVPGVSFQIRSTEAEQDQSEVAWLIVEPGSN